MNFKFLLAVFVVAVALMPTAHSKVLVDGPFPSTPSSGCVTVGGGTTGVACVFPFFYKNKTHTSCTLVDADDGIPWCSTLTDSDGVHLGGQGKWGHCPDSCEADVQVSELSLESVFGPGHEGVVQRTAFRPSLNQTEITVPAHGDGQFVALDVVIQGLGGQDQVQDPYLLTVKEETCFLNLKFELNPTKASSGNTGMMAKKHLIQTNIKRISEDTADYRTLPGKVMEKCEGKEIFRGDYKFLSQDQYEEITETENYIGDSQSSTNLERTKRGSPKCMREHKCAYDGGHGCFMFDGIHIYDGQIQKCVCCNRDCPHSHSFVIPKCRYLSAGTFLKYYDSQNVNGFPYSSEKTCTSPTNGGWSPWSCWNACFTGPNGYQIRERSRQCDNPAPANGGSDCPGNSEETKDCPIDGDWGQWTSWSGCSWKGCIGYSTRDRSRECDDPAPANGGMGCSGAPKEIEYCEPIKSIPITIPPACRPTTTPPTTSTGCSVSVVRGEHGTWNTHPENTWDVTNLLTNAPLEIFAKNYWLAPDKQDSAEFVLSLGCEKTVNLVELVNTHNGHWRERSMKEFKVFLSSDSPEGPWEEVVHQTLEDSRQQPDPLPLQTFPFTARTAKFLKFNQISYYGKGGGLQYLSTTRNQL